MFNPVATYRIQFHKEFTLSQFEKIIDYLQKLGVSTIYASPVFEAVPGSTHGYDGVNPHHVNPEIGSEQQLKKISKKLREKDISWLQDIVPNHMGFHQLNPWLMDVLEKGRLSVYANFFDAAWTSELFSDDQLMVPFLGSPLEDIIKNGELKIAYVNQHLIFKYFENSYPVHPCSYVKILRDVEHEELKQVIAAIPDIKKFKGAQKFAVDWTGWLQQLDTVLQDSAAREMFQKAIGVFNADIDKLTQIANEQVYRLCSFEETDGKINFRRFFTVNSLICLNMQDERVFEHFHTMIRNLVEAGVFQGLRIDHIDGLYDPGTYLQKLRELAGDETYIVAEKILEQGEEMPTQWPLQGNTGYDFLGMVNNLLTNHKAEKKFTHFYEELIKDNEGVQKQIWEKKAYILFEHMGGELNNLTKLFEKLKLANGSNPEDIKQAIAYLLIYCPVYRYYGNSLPLQKEEQEAVHDILKTIRKHHPNLVVETLLFEDIFINKPLEGDVDFNQRALQFYQRCMQFAGPLMAKGVEDTLMYTYNRFIGHNEVGDSPEAFGMSVKDFHNLMKQRQKKWPLSINGTSTHDTKRGEDVRARLNVLTAIPNEWFKNVKHWQKLTKSLKQEFGPYRNDEYFIYQTIAGAWPMPHQDEDNFGTRLAEYLTKALREGKKNSNWIKPAEAYEKATLEFAAALLDKKNEFWKSFEAFHQKIVDYGIINSLSQVLLKFTCPGVPDIYQGTELWDLSLVDPDNRRPVDYELRKQFLDDIIATEGKNPVDLLHTLWRNRYNGQIKQWFVHTLLNYRKQDVALFEKGHYIPLEVKGAYRDHIVAFARRYEAKWYLVAAPLNIALIATAQKKAATAINWKNTRIVLPAEAPEQWQHSILSAEIKPQSNEIAISEIFKELPLAILKGELPENNRGAGILMHITSLPSAFGIGDIGPIAKTFADFLARCRQKIWQMLPLAPTGPDQLYSPYSSSCSMAGNVLLISPILLAKEGLISEDELEQYRLPVKDEADFECAKQVRDKIFEQAYQNFCHGSFSSLRKQFNNFCQKETYWLNDFALYTVLKDHHNHEPWYHWPKDHKFRNETALKKFADKHKAELEKAKWLQFIFISQWKSLKAYCNGLNIQLMGDLPIYVSYDSVDVWAHPDIFELDQDGNMTGVAGVPPDYFNENGQLWGMPVYKWDVLKEQGYDWWMHRLSRNMELFDQIRLDHFRGFEAYWRVPADEETAKNGAWEPGPGADFFNAVKKQFGRTPFVAEDLGDVDEPVFKLRDQFKMPGMKILQFAWGDLMTGSYYIPHNYNESFIVYTGTHDNNTTLGWFKAEATKEIRKQMEAYTGITVKEKNINEVMARLAYASTAKWVILPLQDILGLDEDARMNNPSRNERNWLWRMLPKLVDKRVEERLADWTKLYNRI
jgi:malto-oligosyltrehalose synthase/4-alpha-glucanotransferase